MAALGSGPQMSRDPAARSGSGEVRIVSVDVSGRGADGERITAGSPFAVRLAFEAARPGPSPSLGVEVHGLDGVLIARAESPGDPSAHIAAGPGTAEVVFRRNALLPGAYVLTVFARDPAGHLDYDVQVKAHRFAVWGERTGGERGAVSLDPAWTR